MTLVIGISNTINIMKGMDLKIFTNKATRRFKTIEKRFSWFLVSKRRSPINRPKKKTAMIEAKVIKSVSHVASHTLSQLTSDNSDYCSKILCPTLILNVIFNHLSFYSHSMKFLNGLLNIFIIP